VLVILILLIYTALERERVLLDIMILVTGEFNHCALQTILSRFFLCFSCVLAEESSQTLWKNVSSN